VVATGSQANVRAAYASGTPAFGVGAGNVASIVDETADLDRTVARLVYGAFAYSGQVCISVQRIYVVESVYPEFERRFVEKVRAVKMGDPLDPATDLGPMVDAKAVARTHEWVQEALGRGARALVGGEPDGLFYPPTVLVDAPKDCRVCGEEVFAPVVNLFPVPDFAAAVAEINDSQFGLQCGVFTNDLERTLVAHDELEVGGVIVNDIPTWRTDAMPYGGVKDSGIGREGLRWSIEDMTEPRLLAFARPL
jgi:glyceraldehyde-3-phosphate dehydrogenase (NADP+)